MRLGNKCELVAVLLKKQLILDNLDLDRGDCHSFHVENNYFLQRYVLLSAGKDGVARLQEIFPASNCTFRPVFNDPFRPAKLNNSI